MMEGKLPEYTNALSFMQEYRTNLVKEKKRNEKKKMETKVTQTFLS